jgi:hypothetical protein
MAGQIIKRGERVCNASNGVSIVVYWAVGTRAYQAGTTYTCPQTNPAPTHGWIVFGTTSTTARDIYVNNVYVDLQNPPTNLTVPLTTPFTTFKLDDILKWHAQAWTYDGTLYRDNVLVEQFSKKL